MYANPSVYDIFPCGFFAVSLRFLCGFWRWNQRFLPWKPKVSTMETKGFCGRNLLETLFPESVALLLVIVDDGYFIIETDGQVWWHILKAKFFHILCFYGLLVRFNNAKIQKNREKASKNCVKIVKNPHSVTLLSFMLSTDYQKLTSNNDRMTVFNQNSYCGQKMRLRDNHKIPSKK